LNGEIRLTNFVIICLVTIEVIMKKTIIAAAIALFAVNANAATEGHGEYRWGDTANQVKVELTGDYASPVGGLKVSGEVESAQKYRRGTVDTVLAATVGYPVSVPYGVTVQPFVQLGEKLTSNANESLFFAFGVKASRQIYGDFSGELSFRRRESFHGLNIGEDRLGASVKYAVSKNVGVGVALYNYSGTTTDHRFGVFYKQSF